MIISVVDFRNTFLYFYLCLLHEWLLTVAFWATEFYNKSTQSPVFKYESLVGEDCSKTPR